MVKRSQLTKRTRKGWQNINFHGHYIPASVTMGPWFWNRYKGWESFLLAIILGTVTFLWHHQAPSAVQGRRMCRKKVSTLFQPGDQRQALKWGFFDKDLETQFDKASAAHPRPSGRSLCELIKIWSSRCFPRCGRGLKSLKRGRPPMRGWLTRALCIFRAPEAGLGGILSNCRHCLRKVTPGEHHKRHIIFIGKRQIEGKW